MKKIIFLLAVVTIGTTLSCKKSKKKEDAYVCSSCRTTPEAIAANDAISKGIYKGVIIGSSGTIKFDIANAGNTVSAVMVLDGTIVNLTSNATWTAGQAYTSTFTGTLNGSAVSITLTVNTNGQNPVITAFTIPGHTNASFTLFKETSSSLIECFEGSYTTTKPETGTFNIMLSRSLKRFGGSARATGSTRSEGIDGTIDANGNLIQDGNTVATLSGDELHGAFKDSDGKSVTVTGKRTL